MNATAAPTDIMFLVEHGLQMLLPLFLILVPFGVKWLRSANAEKDRDKLLAIVKGATLIVGEFAKKTSTTLDDSIVEVLKIVQNELGRPLTPAQAVRVKNIALALHVDERFPASLTNSENPHMLKAAALAPVPKAFASVPDPIKH